MYDDPLDAGLPGCRTGHTDKEASTALKHERHAYGVSAFLLYHPRILDQHAQSFTVICNNG